MNIGYLLARLRGRKKPTPKTNAERAAEHKAAVLAMMRDREKDIPAKGLHDPPPDQ
jgi:hypothetical protein